MRIWVSIKEFYGSSDRVAYVTLPANKKAVIDAMDRARIFDEPFARIENCDEFPELKGYEFNEEPTLGELNFLTKRLKVISADKEDITQSIIKLIDECIDFEAIIPPQFCMRYYARSGRKRINPLSSYIKAFVLKLILGFNEDKQLLTLLKFSPQLYGFCGFKKLPDASQLTRFKKDFSEDMKSLFENLVEITAPICKEIDPKNRNI